MVASDDPKWCRQYLSTLPKYFVEGGDVYDDKENQRVSTTSSNVTKRQSADFEGDQEEQKKQQQLVSIFFTSDYYDSLPVDNVHFDLAVLSKCNHSIFDYGTFGFWGAYLASKYLVQPPV